MKYLLCILLCSTIVTSCGGSGGNRREGVSSGNELDQSFSVASAENAIPERLLKAVAFLESGFFSGKQSALYAKAGTKLEIGYSGAETIFGLSRQVLGLTETDDSLATQIKAYGQYVRSKLDASGEVLDPRFESAEEKFRWIWEISKLHRSSEINGTNLQVIFVKEVMAALNKGFFWKDPLSDRRIELTPEAVPLTDLTLPANARMLMQIYDETSFLSSSVRKMNLRANNFNPVQNNPTRVEIVHCPFSFSKCLEMQTKEAEALKLEAHIVIPQDAESFSGAYQVMDHDRQVRVTGNDGVTRFLSNTIVIMMSAYSGNYQMGKRLVAQPMWYTPWQLKRLSAIVRGTCEFLKQRYGSIDVNQCMSADNSDYGLLFRNSGNRSGYFWGDIPDYDRTIFWSYIENQLILEGAVTLQESSQRRGPRLYPRGDNIPLVFSMRPGVKYLRLQRAIRCSDGNMVWETIRSQPIGAANTESISVSLNDGGPNRNGEHFLRASVYDSVNQFMGWTNVGLFIQEYDANFMPAAEACYSE